MSTGRKLRDSDPCAIVTVAIEGKTQPLGETPIMVPAAHRGTIRFCGSMSATACVEFVRLLLERVRERFPEATTAKLEFVKDDGEAAVLFAVTTDEAMREYVRLMVATQMEDQVPRLSL